MIYQGSYCALITPFKNGELDKSSFKKIIKWHIDQGTKGIIPCGTTGESPTLSHDEHKEVVELAVDAAEGKIQVIAGTGSNSTNEAVALTKHAKDTGVDSALIVVPYYNKPNQQGLIEHYLKIANTIDLPIIIYNIPGRSVVDMHNDTIIELAQHKNIIGIKDATNDLSRPSYITKHITNKNSYQLSREDATQMAFLASGGDGVISVTANIAPKKVAEMHNFWFDGRVKEALAIDKELVEINNLLFLESNPCPVKYAASNLGLCEYELRLPLTKISKKNEELISNALNKLSLSYDL